MSCAAVLTPMPGTPGTLSVESPRSDCTSTTLSGLDAELFLDFLRADPALVARHRVVHVDAGPTSCIRSLSPATIVTSRAGRERLLAHRSRSGRPPRSLRSSIGIRPKALHRLAHQRELRDQLVGRRVAVGLVFGIDFVAERVARMVEHDRRCASASRRRCPRA